MKSSTRNSIIGAVGAVAAAAVISGIAHYGNIEAEKEKQKSEERRQRERQEHEAKIQHETQQHEVKMKTEAQLQAAKVKLAPLIAEIRYQMDAYRDLSGGANGPVTELACDELKKKFPGVGIEDPKQSDPLTKAVHKFVVAFNQTAVEEPRPGVIAEVTGLTTRIRRSINDYRHDGVYSQDLGNSIFTNLKQLEQHIALIEDKLKIARIE